MIVYGKEFFFYVDFIDEVYLIFIIEVNDIFDRWIFCVIDIDIQDFVYEYFRQGFNLRCW
jgi:hypothetical protein